MNEVKRKKLEQQTLRVGEIISKAVQKAADEDIDGELISYLMVQFGVYGCYATWDNLTRAGKVVTSATDAAISQYLDELDK